jgi:hypothetical protein
MASALLNDLRGHLATYASGLEAELELLRQLENLAAVQQRATSSHEIEQLQRVADERDRLMTALVHLESQIARSRRLLAEHRLLAATLPGFDAVVALHRTAGNIVGTILSADRETMAALREAEIARRTASQAIEAGEHTLAAYRRVISPSVSGPSLVDRHG